MTAKYDQWQLFCTDEVLKYELESLNNSEDIHDRFYKNLSFGTGGLRGLMGVGTNRMNLYTIRQATQGIINVLKKEKEELSFVIGYDSRLLSNFFAQEVANVCANSNIRAYIFDDIRPTPLVSFAVRELRCDLGIMITASHNPKQYNGYKVYGNDGGQITLELASKFAQSIEMVNPFDVYKTSEVITHEPIITTIDNKFDLIYLDRILKESIFKLKLDRTFKIVYSPIHGAGYKLVPQILEEQGYDKVNIVKEQFIPDGDFPTVQSPNPEEKEALELAIKQAEILNADIAIGTDPDCDRVGIAVRSGDKFVILNGNQVGALLVQFMLETAENISSRTAIVKTIVTSDLGKKIAESYGATVFETLTGFKFIGEKIQEFEENHEYDFLLGFEESYGYLTGTFVRDKDAVISTLLICEMFSYYKSKGLSFIDVLDLIYEKHGHFKEELLSYSFEAEEGINKIKTIVKRFQNLDYLTENFQDINYIEDFSKSERIFINGNIENIILPKSDVIKVRFIDDSWFAIRPSGTEPKLKVYISSLKIEELKKKIINLVDTLEL